MYKILILILVNFIFYWKTLNYAFISDDNAIFARKEPIPKNTLYRWWIQFRCKRYINPKEVHFMNFVVHLINSILIYLVFGQNNIAFLTSLFFTINPITTQSSVWCSGRSYSMSTLLVLLMFLFPILAPLFYFFTKFFSANAIFSPLAFLTTKYWFWSILPLGLIFYIRKGLKEKATTSVSKEMRTIAPRKLITFVKSFGYYFNLCLFPLHLGWHHSFIWGIGVTDKYNKQVYEINREFWWGLFIIFFVSTNLILNWSQPMWGLLWFVVNIAMWCNLMTWQQQIAERFCYLATIGLMYVLVNFLYSLPYNLLFIGGFLGFYACKTWLIVPMYRNEFWRIEHTIVDIPNSHYAWLYRGFKRFHANDFVGALHDFQEALIHSPHEFKINYNLCSAYIMLQNMEKAKEFLKLAEENMYKGEEAKLKPIIDETWKFIQEIEETKNINVNRIVLFS